MALFAIVDTIAGMRRVFITQAAICPAFSSVGRFGLVMIGQSVMGCCRKEIR
jgi:hypothetical protein